MSFPLRGTYCYICKNKVASTDKHHIIPQARGGKKGPKIRVCPTCHTEAHILARAKDIAINNISNARMRKVVLLLKLSQELPHAKYYKVQLDIPEDLYFLLRQEAKDNKISIPKVIISNIRAWSATKLLVKKRERR